MAMAAAASTVCVPPPSSSFSAGASSRECPRAAAATVSSAAVPSTAKAAVSATVRLSASSRRPRRDWRWQAVAEQEQLQAADTEENSEEAGGGGGVPSDSLSIFFEVCKSPSTAVFIAQHSPFPFFQKSSPFHESAVVSLALLRVLWPGSLGARVLNVSPCVCVGGGDLSGGISCQIDYISRGMGFFSPASAFCGVFCARGMWDQFDLAEKHG